MKIYNLGSLNLDYVYKVGHFVQPGETLSSKHYSCLPGGKGLNQSIAASRAGSKVYHIGIIGEDAGLLTKTLLESNVNLNFLNITNAVCGHAIIQVNEDGENCILLFGGSNRQISKKFIEHTFAQIDKESLLLLQNETNNLEYALYVAKQVGLSVMLNPSPIDDELLNLDLSAVSWLVLNEIEGRELTGEKEPNKILDNLLEKYPDMKVVLTLGCKGSIYRDRLKEVVQESYQVTVKDTTAAGDTFTGYFASSLAEGKDVEVAMNLASKAAAITITKVGAANSIPWMKEVVFDSCCLL